MYPFQLKLFPDLLGAKFVSLNFVYAIKKFVIRESRQECLIFCQLDDRESGLF